MRGLPFIKELTGDAKLSAYGTKIVRSGGWSERPVLVEDGLAVGGASAGLGIDIPFPNFTGPASATGLLFARAAKVILGKGRTPDIKNLTKEYLVPLQRERIRKERAVSFPMAPLFRKVVRALRKDRGHGLRQRAFPFDRELCGDGEVPQKAHPLLPRAQGIDRRHPARDWQPPALEADRQDDREPRHVGHMDFKHPFAKSLPTSA